MKKLFIVLRRDLNPGLQAAQACHALQAMNDQHPEVVARWEGNIVLVSCSGMLELSELVCSLQRARVPVALFCEPDTGGEITAAAVAGEAWKQLSQLPLALKPPKAA